MTELQELPELPDVTPRRRLRPSVHFTATDGWINDPYGITWDGEQYHLFYQAIPGRVTWAPNCHWGHAVSPDLVHWTELPLALIPGPGELGCWSGSTVLDQEPPVLLYTRIAAEDWGRGQVAIARPVPEGSSWVSSTAEVLIDGPPDGLGAYAFRDPYVWRTGDGWTMLMAAGLPDGIGAAVQYRSADLMTWTYVGILAERSGAERDGVWTGALWECPQLFPLGDAWVLLVSVWNDDVLHYVAAAIGDYDGTRFVPRGWQRLTYGSSAYAMSAFADKDGRRCVQSWLREEPQNNPALVGYAGAHSLAATVDIVDDRLVLSPHPDVHRLRSPLAVGPDAAPTDVALYVEASLDSWSGLRLSQDGGTRLELRLEGETLIVERPGFPSDELPLFGITGTIRIVVDADLVEVFGPASYGAYRISPSTDGQQRLTVEGATRVDTLAP